MMVLMYKIKIATLKKHNYSKKGKDHFGVVWFLNRFTVTLTSGCTAS